MAPHNYKHYDPVGSNANTQPQRYTYQTPTQPGSAYPSGNINNSYPNSNSRSYEQDNHAYANAQYASNQNAAYNSANTAAAALSSLSGQNVDSNSHTHSNTNRTDTMSQWGSSGWNGATYNQASYGSGNLQPPSGGQHSQSAVYGDGSSATTFARQDHEAQDHRSQSQVQHPASHCTSRDQSNQQTQTSSVPSTQAYATKYNHQHTSAMQQPQRYASPQQAVHSRQYQQQRDERSQTLSAASQQQPSRHTDQTSQIPAHSMTNHSRSSAEPASITVDPSQVYDVRAEQQRKALADAEKRRKKEAEEAARRAEQEAIAAEKKAHEEAARKAEAEATAKAKEAETARTASRKRFASEDKKRSKSAASTLAQMASGANDNAATAAAPSNDAQDETGQEAQMRAMFQKMREFNAMNPKMLARLWDEERLNHTTQSQSPEVQTPAPVPPPPPPPANVATTQDSPPVQQSHAGTTHLSGAGILKQFKRAENPATPTGRDLVPPGKKGALAERAAKLLSAQNSNKVSKKEVLKLLDSQPTYERLCELLEGMGLKFNRANFARDLIADPELKQQQQNLQISGRSPVIDVPPATLSSVATTPAANSSVKRWKSPKSTQSGSQKGAPSFGKSLQSATVDYECPPTFPANDISSGTIPNTNPGASTAPQPPSGNREASQLPHVKPEIKVAPAPRPPANKEEAARKRTFGDLVDLTAQDSDDELPPAKKSMTDAHEADTFRNKDHTLNDSYGKRSYPIPNSHSINSLAKRTASHVPARPSLESVLPSFQPGSTPAPAQPLFLRSSGPSQENLQRERIQGKMLVEPIMRDRVARKSVYDPHTIARDILLATGRHPDMRALNGHLLKMQKLLGEKGGMSDSGGNRSDLATIRWDIIDPEPKAKLGKNDFPEDADVETSDDESTHFGAHTSRFGDNGDGTLAALSARVYPTMRKPKRKHRATRHLAHNSTPGQHQHTLGGETNTTGSRRQADMSRQAARGTPVVSVPVARMAGGSNHNTPSGATGYAALRELDENGNPIKKKGRPFGWRKDVHSRAANGLPPKSSTSSSKKDRGEKSTPGQRDTLRQPEYRIYKCQWRDCKAELHNLETLKKHVVKVHGRRESDDVFRCCWADCNDARVTSSKGKMPARQRMGFDDVEGWIEHVDHAHLQAVAWELGDGPRDGVSDHLDSELSEAYLSDSHGRSVTPLIRPFAPAAAMEATSTVHPILTHRPASAVLGGRAGMGKDEKAAVDELRKLEDQKRVVGPTLDRTGVRLANEKRRMGFLDDEAFEDFIEESDDEVEDDDD